MGSPVEAGEGTCKGGRQGRLGAVWTWRGGRVDLWTERRGAFDQCGLSLILFGGDGAWPIRPILWCERMSVTKGSQVSISMLCVDPPGVVTRGIF